LTRPYDGDVFVRVDEVALNTFVQGDRPGTGHPTSNEIVEIVANALLAAGVLEWIGGEHDDERQRLPPDSQLEYSHGEVTLRSESRVVATTPAKDLDARTIASLAHHLAGALNQRPQQGPWPKQFDV
jgi:hypothetical protein